MFRIYKDNDVIVEGESPLAITGLEPNTNVSEGEYQAVRVEDDRESERVDIPAFTTLPIEVTGVSVNPTTLDLETGNTGTLEATVTPTNATNQNVTWQSSNTDVATVSGGTVTAVSAGSATITVTTEDGGETAACAVTVTDPVVDVTGVSLAPQTSSAETGEAGNRQLTVTIEPSDATNQTVTYSINPSADGLSVSEDGAIAWTESTPAGGYTTTVTTDNGGHTDTHVLTLTEPESEPDPEEPEDPEEGD